MENFVSALREAVRSQNSYAALVLALALPDICGFLIDPKAGSGARFAAWWERYVQPKYVVEANRFRPARVTLNGQDAYALRCALLHQGSDDTELQRARSALSKFQFVESTTSVVHNNQTNDTLNLQVSIFCEDIASGVERFWAEFADDPAIQERAASLVTIRDMDIHGLPN